MFHDWGRKKIHHSSMYYGAAAGEPFVRAFHVWCIYMHRACTCINVHVHTHPNRTDVRYKYFRTVSEMNRTVECTCSTIILHCTFVPFSFVFIFSYVVIVNKHSFDAAPLGGVLNCFYTPL